MVLLSFSISIVSGFSSSFGFSMSSKVFSSSSSNFRGLFRGNRGHQGGSSWGHRGNRESSWGSLRGHRDVGASHSESIDIISNVVHSLENSIGIHILIASSGHSKGILGLSLGTMDVLVSKAELSKLILSMELVGRSNWSNRGNGSCQGERGRGCNREGGSNWDRGCSKRSRREDRLRSRGRSWDKGELFRSKHLVHRNKVVEGRSKRSSHRSWGNGGRDGVDNMVQDGGGDIVDKGNWKTKDRSCRNLIISFNGFSFSLLHTGSSSSGLSMSSKVFSSSSSNFRGLLRGNRGHQGGSSWGHRGNRESSWGSLRGHRDVGASHSESIDIISNVVHSLENSIGIHILIASSGHSKGILGLSLGTMDVLVSKAELSKLILSMELVGRSNWSNRGNGSCQGERGGGCDWDRGGGEGNRGGSKRSGGDGGGGRD